MKRLLILVLALATLASPAWGGGLLIGSGVSTNTSCISDETVLGATGSAANVSNNTSFIYYSKWVGLKTCTIDRVNINLRLNGTSAYNVRVGIYNDSSGVTGAPIISSSPVASAGTNTEQELVIPLGSDVNITEGVAYWFAFWFSAVNGGAWGRLTITDSSSGYSSNSYHATNPFPTSPTVTYSNGYKARSQGLAK